VSDVVRLSAVTHRQGNNAALPYRRVHDLAGRDPLPYGIEANRPMLERLMRHAVDQRILTRPVPVESLFAAV